MNIRCRNLFEVLNVRTVVRKKRNTNKIPKIGNGNACDEVAG